jgi:hypothetical protein
MLESNPSARSMAGQNQERLWTFFPQTFLSLKTLVFVSPQSDKLSPHAARSLHCQTALR